MHKRSFRIAAGSLSAPAPRILGLPGFTVTGRPGA